MPKVWILEDQHTGEMYMRTPPESEHQEIPWNAVEVEINNSLYRQIRANERKYDDFQRKMTAWFDRAADKGPFRISGG